MKKLFLKIFGLIVLIGIFQSCEKSSLDEPQSNDLELKSADASKKSYIVILNDTELNDELSKLKGYEKKQLAVKSASFKILKRSEILDGDISHLYGTALKGFSVKMPPGQLKKLQDDPSVENVKEDQVVTLIDPHVKPDRPGNGGGNNQGTTTDPSQSIPWGINRVGGPGNGTGKTAWIIDTGIDLDHPDLNVDVARSRSFLGGKESNNPDDQNGHGTHVSGTIAAINNSIGVVGVAANAKVVSVRVLDRRGSGWVSDVIAGIDYVGEVGQSGDVANMSLGGSAYSPLDDAVVNASNANGVKFALAAGNESDDANNHSPARANGSYIYTVSAMNSSDNYASWSNYGNPPVDYCAPGVSITSTWKDGGYNTISGTSMATPHVAGVLLLGNANSDGNVNGDPDGNADPIIHR